MKDYLNTVDTEYPIRRDESEKKAFQDFVLQELSDTKYNVSVKKMDKQHNNIIIGNIEKAKVVFSAHYDTPATSLYPNLIMPRRPILTHLYHFVFPIIMAVLSLLLALVLNTLMGTSEIVFLILYLIIYFMMFLLVTQGFKNKHNKNDNTSGVACVLSLAKSNYKEDVAFVLFDNEEKGLLGSKAFNKYYKELMKDKLVVNFDCVGLGKNVLLIAKRDASAHSLYSVLKENVNSNEDYDVKFYPINGSVGNSDYKSFKCGIGVMVCEEKKGIGYYTSKIHTNKDEIADVENIEFLVKEFNKFIEKI